MEIFITDEQDAVEVDLGRLVRLARKVLDSEKVPDEADLSVICIDEETMTELNRAFLGVDGVTDVLAFPMDDDFEPEIRETGPGGRVSEADKTPTLLGDVVLCPAVAKRQAAEQRVEVGAELDLLFVHGLLHLLGYDHGNETEAKAMEARETLLLKTFADHEKSR